MNVKRTLVVGLVFVCLLVVVCCPRALGQTTVVSVQQAVKQGKVEVEVVSLGGATGNTVRVNVRRKVPETLHLQVTPGTAFLSSTGTVQNMAGGTVKGEFIGANTYRPGSVMVLADDAKHGYLVESFCLDYHKPAPPRGHAFSLAICDERAARILQPPPGTKASLWALQCALWIDRAGVSEAELKKRYGNYVTDVEISTARVLLRHAEQTGVAEVPADIAPEVRKEIEKLFSSDPAVRGQAAESLGKMGRRAAPSIPFLAANVINIAADHHLPATVVAVHASAGDALEALEKLGLPALAPLIGELKQRRAAGGEDTAAASEGIAGTLLVDRAIANLKHKNARIRQRAAAMLGVTKNSRAVEPLIAALKDDDSQVQEKAAEALGKISGKDFGKDPQQWQQWWQQNKSSPPQEK